MSACVITATSPPQSPPPAGGEATCLRRRKPLLFGDIAVMLDAGGTQPRHADAVEHALPCRQFLGTHAISLTRLAGREQAAIDGGDHLDRKSNRLNSSHYSATRMPSSALKNKIRHTKQA